jgi:hypothetical protein
MMPAFLLTTCRLTYRHAD